MKILFAKLLLMTIGLFSIVTASAAINPLNAQIRTVFPESVKTVHQYIDYILDGSGYTFYQGENAPKAAKRVGAGTPKGLIVSDVIMSRKDAILMIIGEAYSLVIDHANNQVSIARNVFYEDDTL